MIGKSKKIVWKLILKQRRLWMLKFTITEFLKRLTFQIWRHSYEVTLRWIRWFLLITFIATVLSDLLECHPFTNYWQVSPDPGPHCRQGYAQLLTMGICNILTDVLLVIFPIPIILNSSMTVKRKINLVLLFALSIVTIIVTLYRIPHIIEKRGGQQTRSLWASIEILAATAVANALVLGSFVRDRGVKKQKWKVGSLSESIERSISVRGTVARAWGSDEDLVRDLGIGLDHELRHNQHTSILPRPAPMATSANEDVRYARDQALTRSLSTLSVPGFTTQNGDWKFPTERNTPTENEADASSEDFDLLKTDQGHDEANQLQSMITPRKVSFFDVGGLLESDSHLSPRAYDFATGLGHSNPSIQRRSTQPELFSYRTERKGSAALLQDLGGLLTPITTSSQSTSTKAHQKSHASRNSRPPMPPTRPALTTSTSNWSNSPFSFTSLGRRTPPISDDEDPLSQGDIPMTRLDVRRIDASNQNLNDVGGLLK